MSISKGLTALLLSIFYVNLSLLVVGRHSLFLKNKLTHWWSKSLYYILGFILINAIVIASGLFHFLINH